MLKPMIERIIGIEIPIVKEVELGKRLVRDELEVRLKRFGYNLAFGEIDITFKGKSLRSLNQRVHLYRLYSWYKNDQQNWGNYENMDGSIYTKSQFYALLSEREKFESIFRVIFNYHIGHGMFVYIANHFYKFLNYKNEIYLFLVHQKLHFDKCSMFQLHLE